MRDVVRSAWYPVLVPVVATVLYSCLVSVREWQWHKTTRMILAVAPPGSRVLRVSARRGDVLSGCVVEIGERVTERAVPCGPMVSGGNARHG
ncbi:hypothetical protein BJY24_005700 [Nocardia transvalensis]|uniref:Uncharacterized protein n=1 Tax=Nocardia transvalensis TaxID=37333 RepID=A0A7W9UKQ0_9NOCA|nr:hypothetical protein [Nocardia transvalensis]MBB5916788.1 hypothetical protein [Nocardia transvalensis]